MSIDRKSLAHLRGFRADHPRLLAACLTLSCAVLTGTSLWGQTPPTNIFPATGNVGIGTSAPSSKFQVSSTGGVNSGINLQLTNSSSYATLDFNTPAGLAGQFVSTGTTFANGLFGGDQTILVNELTNGALQLGALGSNGYVTLFTGGLLPGNERMRIDKNGNVGIGTTNPPNKLSVAGTIGAQEVIVAASGADYVFAPDYHLRDLGEVSAFIQQNHHLPEIPSAAEVQEKGVSLGDMQTKLLAKVEELTLHMIEEHEANARLTRETQELREEIRQLRQAATPAKD